MSSSGRCATGPPSPNGNRDCSPSSLTAVVVTGNLTVDKSLEQCFSREAGFILVRCPESIEEVLSCCSRAAPCVLIVDQAFVEKLEPSGFGRILDSGPSTRVLVVGRKDDRTAVENLIRMGCTGFLQDGSSPSILRRAAQSVAVGEFWASRRLLSRMIRDLLSAESPRKLTRREKEILRLVGQGYKNQEIAEQLFISRETVRWHLRSLYPKIGVQDRLSAAFYATETCGGELEAAAFIPKKLPEGSRQPKQLVTSTG